MLSRRPLARFRPSRFTLLLAGIAVLGAALVLAREVTYGVSIGWDSVEYIGVARNLLAGDGFTRFFGGVYKAYPPLYPVLLAAGSLFLFDPRDVAGPLNAVIFGLTIFVAGRYLRLRLQSRFLVGWACLVKDICLAQDTMAAFFLHIIPSDANDLPAHRKQHGFDNLDFGFNQRRVRFDGKCWAERVLPQYDIAAIRTGQYVPGEGQVWKAEFPFTPGQEGTPQ